MIRLSFLSSFSCAAPKHRDSKVVIVVRDFSCQIGSTNYNKAAPPLDSNNRLLLESVCRGCDPFYMKYIFIFRYFYTVFELHRIGYISSFRINVSAVITCSLQAVSTDHV